MVLAAGCAGNQAGGSVSAGSGSGSGGGVLITTTPGAPSGGSPAGPAMPGLHLPDGATAVAGNRVDARSLPASFPREVWSEKGGTVLGFDGQDGGCFTSSAKVTSQTDQQVVIRLIQNEPGTGHSCPMYIRYKPMSVNLAKPLGDRSVVLQLAVVRG
jgi:hypothetical protein